METLPRLFFSEIAFSQVPKQFLSSPLVSKQNCVIYNLANIIHILFPNSLNALFLISVI